MPTTRQIVQDYLQRARRNNERTFAQVAYVLDLTPKTDYPEHYEMVRYTLDLIAMLDEALRLLRDKY